MRTISMRKRSALIAMALSGALGLSACTGDADPYDVYGPNYGYVGPGYYGGYYDNYYYDRDGKRHRRHRDHDHDHDRKKDGDRDRDGNWRDRHGDRDRDRDGDRNRQSRWRDRDNDRSRDRARPAPHVQASPAPAQVTQPDASPRYQRQAPQTIRQQENLRSGGSSVGGGHAPAPARVAPRTGSRSGVHGEE